MILPMQAKEEAVWGKAKMNRQDQTHVESYVGHILAVSLWDNNLITLSPSFLI